MKIMSALQPILATDSKPVMSTSTNKQKLQRNKKRFLLQEQLYVEKITS